MHNPRNPIKMNIKFSLPMTGAKILVKYPPKIPPAIAPEPIKPNNRFASLVLKIMLA